MLGSNATIAGHDGITYIRLPIAAPYLRLSTFSSSYLPVRSLFIMADSPSLSPQADVELFSRLREHIRTIQRNFFDTLKALSLANVDTSYGTLRSHPAHTSQFFPLAFIHKKISSEREAEDIYDRFALSATPDYLVTAEDWTEETPEKPYGDIIQHLEYSGIDNNDSDSKSDNLPQYIFQLGRLMLPAIGSIVAKKLPFFVGIDVLDPQKAVWLIHVRDIAEDPEEGQEWYPPQYVLNQLACLFEGSSSRNPVFHIAQVAPSLEDWLTLDYEAMINNLIETRRRGDVRIKMAHKVEFESALKMARHKGMSRILSQRPARSPEIDKQRSTHGSTTLDMVR